MRRVRIEHVMVTIIVLAVLYFVVIVALGVRDGA